LNKMVRKQYLLIGLCPLLREKCFCDRHQVREYEFCDLLIWDF
jgi:hypothetical protein